MMLCYIAKTNSLRYCWLAKNQKIQALRTHWKSIRNDVQNSSVQLRDMAFEYVIVTILIRTSAGQFQIMIHFILYEKICILIIYSTMVKQRTY